MKEKKNRYHRDDYPQLSESMHAWFTSSTSCKLRTHEQALLKHLLKRIHGKNACSAGFSEREPGLFSKGTEMIIPLGTLGSPHVSLRSDIYHWPVRSRSMDTVLLHHVLEWACHPQRILREASRVLKPGGSLVILGFNPFSLGSVCRFIPGLYPKKMRKCRFYSAASIRNWLNTLGFARKAIQMDLRLAPLHYPSSAKKTSFPAEGFGSKIPCGNIFTLFAIKERYEFIFQQGIQSRKDCPSLDPSYARTAIRNRQRQPLFPFDLSCGQLIEQQIWSSDDTNEFNSKYQYSSI